MTVSRPGVLMRHLRHLVPAHALRGLPDRELLRRFAAGGEEAAFAELVRRHGPMVYRVGRRVLRHGADAEDVFQATFLFLAKKAGSIRKRQSVGPWLHGVAYRLALRAEVAAGRRRLHEGRAGPRPPAADPLAELTVREAQHLLDEELNALAERYRAPLVLCYLEGATQDEAARQLGWSLSTLKRRLERGRALLAARLTRRGFTFPAALSVTLLAPETAPAALVCNTVRAAIHFATTGAAEGTASAAAVALAEGGLPVLAPAKVKAGLALLLAAGILAAGAGLAFRQAPAPDAGEVPQGQAGQPPAAGNRPRTDRHGDPLPAGAIARMGTARLRHADEVYRVVFSPDGKTLAAATREVRLWDVATGKELRRLAVHNCGLSCVAFSPDGKLLASDSHDLTRDPGPGPVLVWEVSTGKLLHRLEGHKNGIGVIIGVIAFSPDGKLIASAGYGKSIRLWDVTAGVERRRLDLPEMNTYTLAFSPDGRLLASGSDDKAVRLWEVATGNVVRQLEAHDPVWAARFSPNGKVLATAGGDRFIRLWDVETGAELRQISGKAPVESLAFSPDGKTLISGGSEGMIQRWDVDTAREAPLPGQDRWGKCVLSPDGKLLVSWAGHAIRLWDMATGRERFPAGGHETPAWAAAFSGDGRTLTTVGVVEGHALGTRTWDTATGREIGGSPGFAEEGRVVAFSPDRKVLAARGTHVGDRALRLWDVATGKLRCRLEHPACPLHIAYAADGKALASASGNWLDKDPGYAIHLWDLSTGREMHRIVSLKHSINALDFSPDGRLLVSAGWDVNGRDHSARVWSTATGKELRRLQLEGGKNGLYMVAFSPDGRLVASASQDGTVRLWEVLTGGEIYRIIAWATDLAFSPDGTTLVSMYGYGWDNTVQAHNVLRLWDVATGQPAGQFPGQPDGVRLILFSPDGRALVSGGYDTTLLVWDVSAGRRKPAARKGELSAKQMDDSWDALAGTDAARAFRAIAELAAAPEQALAFLRARWKPEPAGPQRTASLIARLDDNSFAVRQQATADLEALGESAEPLLRRTLKGNPSLEVRRRVEGLLAKLEVHVPGPDMRRALRAVAVLERIGSVDARQTLEAIAKGTPEARLTREAKAALDRLAKKKS